MQKYLIAACGIGHRKESLSYCSKFTRYSFHGVETYTVNSTTSFATFLERSEYTFNTMSLMKLPAGLNDIFIFRYKAAPFTMFVDFELFFENSLILHESVLGPFLVKLKDHLMTIHVCLGRIETWLMEPMKNINHLEAVFGVKIELPGSVSENVTQTIKHVEQNDKLEHLMRFLMTVQKGRILIFVETEHTCDFVVGALCQSGFPTCSIHGGKPRHEFEDALRAFKMGRCHVMVAMGDKILHGFDIPNIKEVVNYDLPTNIDDYVRRVGVSSRAALSFVNERNMGAFRSVSKWSGSQAESTACLVCTRCSYSTGGIEVKCRECGGGCFDCKIFQLLKKFDNVSVNIDAS